MHIVTKLQAGQQGNLGLIVSRSKGIYSSPVSSLAWSSYRGQWSQGMKLTTDLCLVPRLRISGDIPLFPIHLHAVHRYKITFTSQIINIAIFEYYTQNVIQQHNMLSSHKHLFTLTHSHATPVIMNMHHSHMHAHAHTHTHTHTRARTYL